MSAFKVTGRHLKTGALVKAICLADSHESVFNWASEKFGHTNISVDKTSQVASNLPQLDDVLTMLDGNPFYNPEYETSTALEIADESEKFRNLGKCIFEPDEAERRLWLGTIMDEHGQLRQVQLVITRATDSIIDETDVWQN